jgi:hypothetical protein
MRQERIPYPTADSLLPRLSGRNVRPPGAGPSVRPTPGPNERAAAPPDPLGSDRAAVRSDVQCVTRSGGPASARRQTASTRSTPAGLECDALWSVHTRSVLNHFSDANRRRGRHQIARRPSIGAAQPVEGAFGGPRSRRPQSPKTPRHLIVPVKAPRFRSRTRAGARQGPRVGQARSPSSSLAP